MNSYSNSNRLNQSKNTHKKSTQRPYWVKGRFVMIPYVVMISDKLTPYEKTVYTILSLHADFSSGYCKLKQSTIAREANCSLNSVKRALKHLQELECISIVENFKDNRRTSNYYQMLPVPFEKLSPKFDPDDPELSDKSSPDEPAPTELPASSHRATVFASSHRATEQESLTRFKRTVSVAPTELAKNTEKNEKKPEKQADLSEPKRSPKPEKQADLYELKRYPKPDDDDWTPDDDGWKRPANVLNAMSPEDEQEKKLKRSNWRPTNRGDYLNEGPKLTLKLTPEEKIKDLNERIKRLEEVRDAVAESEPKSAEFYDYLIKKNREFIKEEQEKINALSADKLNQGNDNAPEIL